MLMGKIGRNRWLYDTKLILWYSWFLGRVCYIVLLKVMEEEVVPTRFARLESIDPIATNIIIMSVVLYLMLQ